MKLSLVLTRSVRAFGMIEAILADMGIVQPEETSGFDYDSKDNAHDIEVSKRLEQGPLHLYWFMHVYEQPDHSRAKRVRMHEGTAQIGLSRQTRKGRQDLFEARYNAVQDGWYTSDKLRPGLSTKRLLRAIAERPNATVEEARRYLVFIAGIYRDGFYADA